jgi:hypothetical protein
MSMHPEYSTEADRLDTGVLYDGAPCTGGPGGLDWACVVEGAAAASIALPFMHAFASKAGEDVYQAMKALIKRLRSSPQPVSFYDPSTNTELVFVPPLPDEAIKQLAGMAPAGLRNRVVTWHAEAGAWQISAFMGLSTEMAPGDEPGDGGGVFFQG